MGTCSSNAFSSAAAYAIFASPLFIEDNRPDSNISASSRSPRVSVVRPETEAAALMELVSSSCRAPVASPFKSTRIPLVFTTGKESRRRTSRRKARAKTSDRCFHWNPARVRDVPLFNTTVPPSRVELTLAVFLLVAWWISGRLSILHLLRQYITGPIARALSWARACLRRSLAASIGAAAQRSPAAVAAGRDGDASTARSSSRGGLAEAGGTHDEQPNIQGPVAFVRGLYRRRVSFRIYRMRRETGTLRLSAADDAPSGEARSDVSAAKLNGRVGARSTRWKLARFTSMRK